ncbi:MAG: Ribosomal RNA small subunit methyltransferase G [Chloroflexi bacterium ADurb.Bin120]|jgi:16S rRNA (guanine527-N7)-methyltransferase|uniref:Ribosomal RNA small subunit methyltransferase G n=1 Tax=Candidatus Brevifilum fermentans TaxID=1986204 RepID=A0A1Y6K6K6_9CHLR|nr:16S rRNA (guanine(527)-N(7))-methyltransferase RsmG [Brevefilum fermentans]MDI9566604.1 16S rRNA (guanine(527)-N(7))-methyltransferase RsmG [Chloroflexota bacterium]OQB86231.1 MAG: Ribosomal RNA small subunit methyltransferase G [Chloroflexi bacterium ADurb.Bin120]SMX55342.1 Ribosomal RNA small subunit methyltransferase G [Brevefilum fermentans]HOM67203.1 16S rRNA (guanine(527)-N(7))-methyltransferase RsmG [Brevefilum fermentans]
MQKLIDQVRSVLGFELSNEKIALLKIYENELLEWNQKVNLTAVNDPEGVRVKHFLDSMTVQKAWGKRVPPERLIDVGTGAGFPGLVLKVLWPKTRVTLVESVGKKAEFCRHIVQRLGLEQVTILSERAEVVGQDPDHRQTYELAVARAVARMPILMEYLLPLVHRNGKVLAMKGETAPVETHSASRAIHLLGGKLHKLVHIELPGVVEERFIVIVDKVAQTPDEYPRRTGIPSKRPIQ